MKCGSSFNKSLLLELPESLELLELLKLVDSETFGELSTKLLHQVSDTVSFGLEKLKVEIEFSSK